MARKSTSVGTTKKAIAKKEQNATMSMVIIVEITTQSNGTKLCWMLKDFQLFSRVVIVYATEAYQLSWDASPPPSASAGTRPESWKAESRMQCFC